MIRAAILASTLVGSFMVVAADHGAGRAVAARCLMSQLAVELGPAVSEATEQDTLVLRLVNRGRKACVLLGYPHVTFSDHRGVIPFVITDSGDQMISGRPPRPVRLRHGGVAFLLLNKSTCETGFSRQATMLRLTTPGVPGSGVASLRLSASIPFPYRVPDYCVNEGNIRSGIDVSPFVPTVRAGLNG